MDSHRGPGDVLASALLHLHWKMSLYSSDLHQNKVWHLGLDETKKKKKWCSLWLFQLFFFFYY